MTDAQTEALAIAPWHLGSMNDGLFIIDTPPRPSTDDSWHDRPDGPDLVLNVTDLPIAKAQAIVAAHNTALAAKDAKLAAERLAFANYVAVTDEKLERAEAQRDEAVTALNDVMILAEAEHVCLLTWNGSGSGMNYDGIMLAARRALKEITHD